MTSRLTVLMKPESEGKGRERERELGFNRRGVSSSRPMKESLKQVHSHRISIQTPGNFEFWDSQHRTRQYMYEAPRMLENSPFQVTVGRPTLVIERNPPPPKRPVLGVVGPPKHAVLTPYPSHTTCGMGCRGSYP